MNFHFKKVIHTPITALITVFIIIERNNKKKQISINIEIDTISYFKVSAKKVGISYQNLINSYLTDCAIKRVEPKLQWG